MRVCKDVETSSAASEMTAQMLKMFSSSKTAIGKSGAHVRRIEACTFSSAGKLS